MRSSLRCFGLSAFAGAMCEISADAFALPEKGVAFEQVTVSHRIKSPAINLHEPLVVEVRVTHQGSKPVVGDLGFNQRGNFSVTVTPPSGAMSPALMLERGDGVAAL
jgi:hypothetical protein